MNNSSNESSDSKDGKEKGPMIASAVAVIAAMASSGFFIDLMNNNGNDRRNRAAPNGTPATFQFVTEDASIRLADLEGEWRFAKGDDPAWAEPSFDDTSWRPMNVPDQWSGGGLRQYDGFGWYRKSFRLAEPLGERPVFLKLGRVDDVEEVFLNGRRVGGLGSFPPNYRTAWDRNRIYRLPEGVLKEDEENLIAVRVYDAEQGGGIYQGDVGLYTTDLPQPLIDLAGEWKFRTGDDPDWKSESIDESEFQTVRAPAPWENVGFDGYDGVGWYRKSFGKPNVNADEEMVLVLGRIDDTDTVFLNGEQIGKTGDPSKVDKNQRSNVYRKFRAYTFSASLLKENNQIAVRVYDSRGMGGLYSGPMGIMRKTDRVAYLEQIEEAEKWTTADVMDWLMGRD